MRLRQIMIYEGRDFGIKLSPMMKYKIYLPTKRLPTNDEVCDLAPRRVNILKIKE